MAEPFGIAAGALGIAGLFNNCIDSFEYVQLGRQFGRDYERWQLQLDIAQGRLVGAQTDKSVQPAQSILGEIVLLFESSWKKWMRYELAADQQDLVVFEDKDMRPESGTAQSAEIPHPPETEQTSLLKKTAWALGNGKSLEKIASQTGDFAEKLEKAFPAQAAVEGEAGLVMLKDAAEEIDTALSDTAPQKVAAIAGRNSAKDIRTEDRRAQVGNTFTEAALDRLRRTYTYLHLVFLEPSPGTRL
ncbi:hypothetical protein ACRALDRAFT_2043971 [Sodiomyces alcalophilus JCM 7366]|uniref:uncharacterized protein n=1 Tax=Sodiomyces alcalophilus JCM 7366 TaxID=591952 RepID=UPI0039B3C431